MHAGNAHGQRLGTAKGKYILALHANTMQHDTRYIAQTTKVAKQPCLGINVGHESAKLVGHLLHDDLTVLVKKEEGYMTEYEDCRKGPTTSVISTRERSKLR
jgi:hypothetical protein